MLVRLGAGADLSRTVSVCPRGGISYVEVRAAKRDPRCGARDIDWEHVRAYFCYPIGDKRGRRELASAKERHGRTPDARLEATADTMTATRLRLRQVDFCPQIVALGRALDSAA